ncbi:hypothetical protein [Puniceibacterium sp. IMCC21224]|uniref:DUF6950 family protein n=1 Tax=Puniceibacterium sp. IMCC21224 TaxID=1618204 RepID=UPI00064E00F7|nr:hypothetical protein [Puniceibacterium sp. IMCC21224]
MGLEFHPAIERARAIWRSTPFDWNGADCMASVCDYVADRWGVDPASPWRGAYSDEAGARAI